MPPERPLLDGHSAAARRRAVWHACSVLPSLLVPGLVGPFTCVVIAAHACLDACVWAGKGRSAAGRFSDVRGGWWSVRGRCGSRIGRGLNDGCGLAAELLVVSLRGG